MRRGAERAHRRGLPGDGNTGVAAWRCARIALAALIYGCALSAAAFAAAQNPNAQPATGQASIGAVRRLTVGDFVEVRGITPVPIHGYGVVTGLPGTGDSPRGGTSTILQRYLQRIEGEPLPSLESRAAALVVVTAEFRPFQRTGTEIDVRVAATGDSRSLEGGILLMTPLRSPAARTEDESIYVLAQGPIIVDGQGRAGNLTTGRIPGGGRIQDEWTRGEALTQRMFVSDITHPVHFTFPPVIDPATNEVVEPARTESQSVGCPTFYLELRRLNFHRAVMIASNINDFLNSQYRIAGSTHFAHNPLARAIDNGTVQVRIPNRREPMPAQPPGGIDPVQFLRDILASPVALVNDPGQVSVYETPMVSISPATGTISISGNVTVHAGRISTNASGGAAGQNRWVTFQEGAQLADILDDVSNVFTNAELIQIIQRADAAGLVEGVVDTQ